MLTKIRQFVSLSIGDLSWKPPGWLRRLCGAGVGWVHAHRRASAVLALLLVASVVGGWKMWDEYQRRPKPLTVSVVVEPPGVTPLDKELKPKPLVIRFGASVAKLEQVERGKPQPAATPVPPDSGGRGRNPSTGGEGLARSLSGGRKNRGRPPGFYRLSPT